MEGAIHSTRNAVLTVDDSPVLCQDHVLPYAQAVMESSWAKSYQEEIRRLRDTSNQVFTMDYSSISAAAVSVVSVMIILMLLLIHTERRTGKDLE